MDRGFHGQPEKLAKIEILDGECLEKRMKKTDNHISTLQHQRDEEVREWLAKRQGRESKEKRMIQWIARLGSAPLCILALGNVAHIVFSLSSGKIKEVSKYGSRPVLLDENAVGFWVSVFYNSTLTVFLLLAAFICLRSTGWFKKNHP